MLANRDRENMGVRASYNSEHLYFFFIPMSLGRLVDCVLAAIDLYRFLNAPRFALGI